MSTDADGLADMGGVETSMRDVDFEEYAASQPVSAAPLPCRDADPGGHSGRRAEIPRSTVVLGHASVDRDHQHLLSLVARFADLAIGGARSGVLAEAACDLTEFTRSHFEYEEALMAGAGYPDLDAHCRDHAELMRQLSVYLYGFSASVDVSPTQIVGALQLWFANHLRRFDAPMVEFLRADAACRDPVRAGDGGGIGDRQRAAASPME